MTKSCYKRHGALALLISASLSLSACPKRAFSPSFPDNRADELTSALAELKTESSRAPHPTNANGRPLVFFVTAAPSQIICYDLGSAKIVWSVKSEISSRVVVGNQQIFYRSGKNQVAGRSILDGQKLWSKPLPEDQRLLGLTTDGEHLYYATEVFKRSAGRIYGQLISLDGESGSNRWHRPSSGRIGAPAARGGLLFVPLRSQSVAVISAKTGDELARVRSKEETLLWARTDTGGVLFGGTSGIYRLDKNAVSGTQKGSSFLSAKLPKSVRPVYWWNGYNAALSGYTAYDRNRLLWRISPGGTMTFRDDIIFVHNYRFVFAFSTKGDKETTLQWAYTYPREDAVASTYTGAAVVLATAHGHLAVIDAKSGIQGADVDVGIKDKVIGATFDIAGYAPASSGGSPRNLRDSLKEVVFDPDRRFGSVKIFAIEQLAQLRSKSVTTDLVNIVTGPKLDKAVYQRAGDMIVERHDKAALPLYLKTLDRTYSFVDGKEAAAVGVMARAVGDLKAKEATKSLLAHLRDNETPLEAVVEVVKALSAIGDKRAVKAFRDYLLTYRCDPRFAEPRAQSVLNHVAEALLRLGNEDERQLLVFVQNDVHSIAPLRAYIAKALREFERRQAPDALRKGQAS